MKVVSYNVNSLRAIIKKESFLEFINSHNADILSFQETKINDTINIPGLEKYKYCYHAFAKKKGYSGVSVFSKYEAKQLTYNDPEGRVLVLDYDKFIFINIYVMNSGVQGLKRLDSRINWDIKFYNYLKSLTNKNIIICGDFNTVSDPVLDYWNLKKPLPRQAGLLPEERKGINKLYDLGFIDTFRYLHPQTKKYSYYNYRSTGDKGWRIDYIMISSSLKNKLISADIKDNILGSDHRPVVASIKLIH